MKIVRESLNEEILGKYDDWGQSFTVYKNPPSIRNMNEYVRGFHDQFGNFYVADLDGKGYPDTIHGEIIAFVKEKFPEVKIDWVESQGAWTNGIAWQRYESTNDFYFSESYSISNQNQWINEVKEIMSLPNFFTPSRVKWKLKDMPYES